jgi:predicted nuclease of predicted toxin-antitoxin system
MEQIVEYQRRKAKPRFYADENFPTQAVKLVRAKGVKVLTAKEAGRTGHPDENHAAYVLKTGRVLLTCDRDYLDERRFPLISCPVIVVCNFGSGSSIEMQRTFRCLRTMLGIPQVFDKWSKIDAKPEAWVEYSRFLDGTTARSRYRVYSGRLQEWVD